MKNKITVRIRQAEEDKGTDAYWILIDRKPLRKTHVDNLREALGVEERLEDAGNVAYPVLESELEAIRDAIDKFLKGGGKNGRKN